jgi:hypothetical protein
MCRLRCLPRAFRRNERGQVIVLAALLMIVLMGFTGMALDVGSMASDKSDLQNAADAMALAAAAELPNTSAANASAREWATKNGVDLNEIESIQIQQQSLPSVPNPQVTVTLERRHDFVFFKAVGVSSTDIGASASAIRTSFGGDGGLMPWTVLKSLKDAAIPGETLVLKYDSNDATSGNFGAIRIDGSGASVYLDTLENGADSTICSEPALDLGCQENAPNCNDAECDPETGNLVGATRTGVDYRMDNTDPACDTFEEAFASNGDGTFRLNAECNPFLASSKPSLQVVIIPVVDALGNGQSPLTITDFALFYLEGYDNGKCSGHACEIKGRFVRADISTGGLVGVYNPGSLLQFVKLVE